MKFPLGMTGLGFNMELPRRARHSILSRALIFAAVAVLLLARGEKSQAVAIPINLGSSGFSFDISFPFNDLNGTSLAGQNLSVDFIFTNPAFVRLFTVTTDFGAAVRLDTNGSDVGFLTGTGFLIDAQGNALHTAEKLGSASSSSTMFASLFPPAGLQRPVDFFGVHYDLMFPNNPGVDVTGGQFRLFTRGAGGPFGIGPDVPADLVPDIGGTLLLFGIGLGALGVLRSRMATAA
jgi:hypothetical protein